jgi:hypothetical protein
LDGENRVLCLHNVSDESLDISIDLKASALAPAKKLVNLSSGEISPIMSNRIEISLEPYQFRWLQAS